MKSKPNFPAVNLRGVAACLIVAVTCLALAGCSSRRQTVAPPRQRILLDAGWRFALAPDVTLTNAVAIANWRWKAARPGRWRRGQRRRRGGHFRAGLA